MVDLGDITVGHFVNEPGWRWYEDVRPTVGGEWCQARHLGIILSGRLGVRLSDGTELEFGPDDVFDIPPGHDGWTIGDEPCIQIEWAGIRAFAGFPTGIHSRVLVTLLFTDLVDSTAHRRPPRRHEVARAPLPALRGRAASSSSASAGVRSTPPATGCSRRSRHRRRRSSARQRSGGRQSARTSSIRAGVHVGEVEQVGRGIRGVAVHEAARIMGQAGPDEILVSETTRLFARASDLEFEDRGVHSLKGLEGDWRLAAFVA